VDAGGGKPDDGFRARGGLVMPRRQEPRIAAPHLIRERIAFRPIAPPACEVEPHRDGVRVIPIGELDLEGASLADARLGELRAAGEPALLDLDELDFMDSSGLRLVLNAAEASDATGWPFSVTRGPEQVQRLFESTRVTERLPIVPRPG
jgi:anti-anti-sigma factor